MTAAAPIRIIVADDHALFRAGLIRMLESFEGVEVVAEAANATEVLAAVDAAQADLLLLDLSMPGAVGVSLIERVHQARPALNILILSMHDEVSLVRKSLKSGASGFVTKNAAPDVLQAAVTELHRGRRFVEPSIAASLAVDVAPPAPAGARPELTARELQILRMITEQGLSLAEIAQKLELSPKTVTAHKANIMAKLGVQRNVELIRYVIEHHIFG